MVPVKPGEKGEWTILGEEGIDNDGDGLINEDAEGYVDPNRQWGFDWAPEYVQSGSGEYPFQAVGLKALALWTQTKTNICMGWTFHNFGGMYLRGPSRKGLGEYPPQDVAVYDYIGKQAERITPGYKYMISWKDLYTTYGDSLEWLCQTIGRLRLLRRGLPVSERDVQGGRARRRPNRPAAAGEEGPRGFLFGDMTDRERLKYSDNLTQGELYKPWKPFKHPVYGDIEIGGWVKMSSRLAAPFMLPDLVHRNAMAVLFSAKHTPEVEPGGDGGQEARRGPLPRPDTAGQRQGHADDELPGPEDPDLSQGHAQGLGPERPRSWPAASSPTPTPTR